MLSLLLLMWMINKYEPAKERMFQEFEKVVLIVKSTNRRKKKIKSTSRSG